MKEMQYLILISVIACYDHKSSNGKIQRLVNQAPKSANATEKSKAVSWTGMINSSIPVFISYSIQDSLVVGEICYLLYQRKETNPVIGYP